MPYDGGFNKKMDAAAEIERNLVSKHQIHSGCVCGDDQADAGRDDCRTRLARSNSQARTRTGKYSFSADHE